MRQLTYFLVGAGLFAVMGCTQPVATKSTKTLPKVPTEATKPEVAPAKPAEKPPEKPAEKPPEKPPEKPADKPGDKTPPK